MRLLFFLMCLLFPGLLYSQVYFTGDSDHKFSSSYLTGNTVVTANSSISLLPGFSTNVYNFWAKVVPLSLSYPDLTLSLSADKNYILTKQFRVSGVKSGEENAARSIQDQQVMVQYFDGLGRVIQDVSVMGSPTFKDIVVPHTYDAFGRPSVKHLPYADSNTSYGSYRSNAMSSQLSFYDVGDAASVKTSYPFSKTLYEANPLHRVSEQGAPGSSWQPYSASISGSGHTSLSIYGNNRTTEVLRWTVELSGASALASYGQVHLQRPLLRMKTEMPQFLAL